MRFVADIPGEFKSMVVHQNRLFVLTDRGVFEEQCGELVLVPFVEHMPVLNGDGSLKIPSTPASAGAVIF
jgi:hypothetical protein